MDTNEDYSKNMSKTEKQVMDVLLQHKSRPEDIHNIAKVCGISDLQAAVAMQLLAHKKLIPPSDMPR